MGNAGYKIRLQLLHGAKLRGHKIEIIEGVPNLGDEGSGLQSYGKVTLCDLFHCPTELRYGGEDKRACKTAENYSEYHAEYHQPGGGGHCGNVSEAELQNIYDKLCKSQGQKYHADYEQGHCDYYAETCFFVGILFLHQSFTTL